MKLKKADIATFGLIVAMIGGCGLDGCNPIASVVVMVVGGLFVIPYVAEFNREMKRRDKK